MIHEELEKRPDLRLKLMQQSGIKGIKHENIIPIETGSRGYCYIIKNTAQGDILCKIDDETGAKKFPARYKGVNLKRQEESTRFQQSLAEANYPDTTAPYVFEMPDGQLITNIESRLTNYEMPKDLVGKQMFFMEKVKGKHLDPKPEYKQPWEKFYMKLYEGNRIEQMMGSVANMHDLGESFDPSNISAYLVFDIPEYKQAMHKLSSAIGKKVEDIDKTKNFHIKATPFADRVIPHRNNLIQDCKSILKNAGIAVVPSNEPEKEILSIQLGVCQYLKEKYGIETDLKKLDQIRYKNEEVSQKDILLVQKALFLQTLQNSLDTKAFRNILGHISTMEKEWSEISSLPNTFTHNDVHPMNFMFSEDGKKTYMIDFAKSGYNKRIMDLGFVITTNNNPSEEAIKAMINGYRLKGNGHISEKELERLYDVWKAVEITALTRELEDINYIMATKDYSLVKTSFDVKEHSEKLDKLAVQSSNNQVPRIFKDSQNELLDGLDLQDKRPVNFSYRNANRLARNTRSTSLSNFTL